MAWRLGDEPSRWDYLPEVEATYWFAPIWSERRHHGPPLDADEEEHRLYSSHFYDGVGAYVPAHYSGAIALKAETLDLAKVEAARIWYHWEATPFGRREADGYRIVENSHQPLETRYFRGTRAPGGRDANPRQPMLPVLVDQDSA
jgi:hypothetical protein